MKIKIIFFKSSSKYYNTVCLQCESFDSYVQVNFSNTLILDLNDIKQKRNKIKNILETVRNWTKTEY